LFIFLESIIMLVFPFSISIVMAGGLLVLLMITSTILTVVSDSAFHHEFDSKIRASLGSVNNVTWAVGYSIAVFLAGLSINFFGVIPTLLISGGLSLLEGLIYLIGLKKD